MYYIRVRPAGEEEADRLEYYCRNCGNVDTTLTAENICVSKTSVRPAHDFKHVINQYTKHDPTLPRTQSVPCPNPACATNAAHSPPERDILYIRYDDANMKFVYLCATCDTAWQLKDT